MAPYACHAHASCGQLRRPVVGAARAEIGDAPGNRIGRRGGDGHIGLASTLERDAQAAQPFLDDQRDAGGIERIDRTQQRLSVFVELSGQQGAAGDVEEQLRSEEHTSELQSLMRISYAVFCLKKKRPTQDTAKL